MKKKARERRRALIVKRYRAGESIAKIARRYKVSERAIYGSLQRAGVIVSQQRCIRDGTRARYPEVVIDGVVSLLCDGCKKILLPMTGIEEVDGGRAVATTAATTA